jgi:hypothetical protein
MSQSLRITTALSEIEPETKLPNSAKNGGILADRMKESYGLSEILRWAHELAGELVTIHAQHPELTRALPLTPQMIILDSQSGELRIAPQHLLEKSALELDKYRAPEFFHQGTLGKEADIWSYGLLFFELSKGSHPFGDCDDMASRFQNTAPRMEAPYKVTPPEELRDIIDKCLLRDPKNRLNARRLQRKVSRIRFDPNLKGADSDTDKQSRKRSYSSFFIVLLVLLVTVAVLGFLVVNPMRLDKQYKSMVLELQSDQSVTRHNALGALKKLLPGLIDRQKKETLTILIVALEERDALMRRDIAKTIRLYGPDALPLLSSALNDPLTQAGAIQAIREFDLLALPLLQDILQSQQQALHTTAITLISNLGPSKELSKKDPPRFEQRRQILMKALNHPKKAVRRIATSALAQMAKQHPETVGGFAKHLEDVKLTPFIAQILTAAGKVGIPHLIKGSQHSNKNVRWAIYQSLKTAVRKDLSSRKDIFPILVQGLLDRDPKIKKLCQLTLNGFPIQSLEVLVSALPKRHIGLAARRHIVRLGPNKVGKELLKHLAHKKSGPTIQGIIRVFCLADPKMARWLLEALEQESIRPFVLEALVAAGPFIITTINQELLNEKSPRATKLHLLEVLKRIGVKGRASQRALSKLNKNTRDLAIQEASFHALKTQKHSHNVWIPVLLRTMVLPKQALREQALAELQLLLGGSFKNYVIQSWRRQIRQTKAPARMTQLAFLLEHIHKNKSITAAAAQQFATTLVKDDSSLQKPLALAVKIPDQSRGAQAVLKALESTPK